jgi:hypothetical protein
MPNRMVYFEKNVIHSFLDESYGHRTNVPFTLRRGLNLGTKMTQMSKGDGKAYSSA